MSSGEKVREGLKEAKEASIAKEGSPINLLQDVLRALDALIKAVEGLAEIEGVV